MTISTEMKHYHHTGLFAGLLVVIFSNLCLSTDESTVVQAVHNQPIELKCTVAADGTAVVWKKKDGTEEFKSSTDPKRSYDLFPSNNTLRVIKVVPATAGDYQCIDASSNKTQLFTVLVKPVVIPFEKGKNVIQGDPLTVVCNAWGVPAPVISWFVGEGLLVPEGSGGRIVLKNGTAAAQTGFPSLDNVTLRVEKMDYKDAGKYMCVATSPIGSSNATIQVEVKDKFAALWPFLGICAEVAVLCAIILIYERRRAKRLAEEEAQEEAAHLNSNNDKKTPISDDVRQRK